MRTGRSIYKISCVLLIFCACHSSKRLGKNEFPKPQESVVHVIDIQDTAASTYVLEQRRLDTLDSLRPKFHTFEAKARLTYTDKQQAADLSAHLVMVKDSLTWLQISGPLGFELMRILLVNDTISIIDRLHKTVMVRHISYLTTITGVLLTHSNFQQIFIGKPVLADNKIQKIIQTADSLTGIQMTAEGVTSITFFDNANSLPVQSDYLNDNRRLRIIFQYDDFRMLNRGSLPYEYGVNVLNQLENKEELVMELFWNYKSVMVNQPVEYLFVVPDNYTQL
jgi:hypothetical protein